MQHHESTTRMLAMCMLKHHRISQYAGSCSCSFGQIGCLKGCVHDEHELFNGLPAAGSSPGRKHCGIDRVSRSVRQEIVGLQATSAVIEECTACSESRPTRQAVLCQFVCMSQKIGQTEPVPLQLSLGSATP